MTAIKICGITRIEDAALAVDLGVHALGFVFWPTSPRAISFSDAAQILRDIPPLVATIGVFVDPTPDELERALSAGVSALQVHGDARACDEVRGLAPRLIRAAGLNEEDGAITPAVDPRGTILLDAHDPVRRGGTGRTIDWRRAAIVAARRRVILAGGLTPANVAEAIQMVRPYGVDVASGVEERPGIKDPAKMHSFVTAVRSVTQAGTYVGRPFGAARQTRQA